MLTLFVLTLKIASLAVQATANMPLTPFLAHDPGPIDPRWPVPDMLIVATFQLRNPMSLFVSMKCKNFSLHGVWPDPSLIAASGEHPCPHCGIQLPRVFHQSCASALDL